MLVYGWYLVNIISSKRKTYVLLSYTCFTRAFNNISSGEIRECVCFDVGKTIPRYGKQADLSYLLQNDDLLNTAKSLLEHREEVANRLSGGGDTGMSDIIRALNQERPPFKKWVVKCILKTVFSVVDDGMQW